MIMTVFGIFLFLGGIVTVVCGMFDFSMASLVNTSGDMLVFKVITLSFALPAAIVGGIILQQESKSPKL